jgi:hypothetical protein
VLTTTIWYSVRGSELHLANPETLRGLAGGIGWNTLIAAIGVAAGALIPKLRHHRGRTPVDHRG